MIALKWRDKERAIRESAKLFRRADAKRQRKLASTPWSLVRLWLAIILVPVFVVLLAAGLHENVLLTVVFGVAVLWVWQNYHKKVEK